MSIQLLSNEGLATKNVRPTVVTLTSTWPAGGVGIGRLVRWTGLPISVSTSAFCDILKRYRALARDLLAES